MTGVMMALAGGASGLVAAMTVGTYNTGGKVPQVYKGYATSLSGAPSTFGSFTPTAYKGATIRALYESDFGAGTYFVVSGNQTAVSGFVNQILIDGGSIGSTPTPTYNSGSNYTQWIFPATGLIAAGTQIVIVR